MDNKVKCKIKYAFDEETKEKEMEVEGNIYSLAYGIYDLINIVSRNTNTNFSELVIEFLKNRRK